jgi:hypothetical protein
MGGGECCALIRKTCHLFLEKYFEILSSFISNYFLAVAHNKNMQAIEADSEACAWYTERKVYLEQVVVRITEAATHLAQTFTKCEKALDRAILAFWNDPSEKSHEEVCRRREQYEDITEALRRTYNRREELQQDLNGVSTHLGALHLAMLSAGIPTPCGILKEKVKSHQ